MDKIATESLPIESLAQNLACRPSNEDDRRFLHHLLTVTMTEYMEAVGMTTFEQEAAITLCCQAYFQARPWTIVRHNGTPVAGMSYKSYGSLIHLWGFSVLPEYQNRGIGSWMMERLLKVTEAESQGIRLEVFFINPRARIFYERHGFVEVARTHIAYIMYRPPQGERVRKGIWESLQRIFSPNNLPWEHPDIG